MKKDFTVIANETKIDFDVEANIHYRYDNVDDLLNKDKETLIEIIYHHYTIQNQRLSVLDKYYKAQNVSVMNRERLEENKANIKMAHNFGKIFTQFDVGYSTGNPIKIEVKDDEINEEIQSFNQENDIDSLNSELWLDVSKYGRAYELMYRSENDKNKIALSNVFETFVIYDTTIERKPILAIRYTKLGIVDESGIKINIVAYTDKEVIKYKTCSITSVELQEIEKKEHSFGIVPVIEYSSNRFRQGLYEDIISLIDAYDFSQSDTANYMSDLNDATLVIKGNFKATGSDDEEQQTINENFAKMKDANLILLQNGVDANGNMTTTEAGYIYKQYDVNGTEAYKKRISKDMHEIANIPDLTDESFAGSQSGEAMKYKLFGFEQYTSTRQKIFVKSLMQRYVLLTNIKNNLRELSNNSLDGFKVTFTPNLPKAVLEELKALIDSGANISQKTMLSLASFISDPEAEMQKVDEEEKETTQSITDLQNYIEKNLNNNQEIESSD